MAWLFEQTTGWMISQTGARLAQGYSGAGAGKNNPAYENVEDVGVIPAGTYTINAPIDSPTHGPYAMPLVPSPANEMFGRSEFLIHGDSLEHPGAASEGCIILPRFARERIWESLDHQLVVVFKAGGEDAAWPNS